MENNKNHVSLAIQYGIILAVLRTLVDFIPKQIDSDAMVYYSTFVIGFVLEFILIFIAIKTYRDKINKGLLSMSEGIKIGVIMMIITGAFIFISLSFIEPDFMMSKSIAMIEEYSPEQLEETLEKFEEAKANPRYFLAFGKTLLYYMFLGLILSAIASAILKKEDNQY